VLTNSESHCTGFRGDGVSSNIPNLTAPMTQMAVVCAGFTAFSSWRSKT
jgi:hypothetical protein